MKSTYIIFGWILLGAVATGSGTGFFLYQANKDRAALIAQKMEAETKSNQLIAESQKLADEANHKLDQAAVEIKNAEDRVKALETEHELIGKATPLGKSSTASRWPEHLSVPLGLSIHMPSAAEEIQNDASALIFKNRYGNEAAEPWLVVEPYQESRESEWTARLQSASQIIYLVEGHLLIGVKGTLKDGGGTAYVFRVQMNASSTQVIWAGTDRSFDAADLENALGTLTLRQ